MLTLFGSNFCEALKKIQKFVRPTRSLRQQWPLRRTKNGNHSIVFSVQGTGGSPTGSDPENRVSDQDTVSEWSRPCQWVIKTVLVSDQDTVSPVRPVSSGLQVPSEPGHCRARTRPPWWPSRHTAFFLQNVRHLRQQR